MNNLEKKILNGSLLVAFILATLSLAGCGDSEMAKGITDAVKKSVGSEIAQKGGEIKKQFDQIINLGTGKGQKEKSEKSSGKESAEEND